jgi:ribokinase
MVVKTARLPAPGETVLGGEFLMAGGGKGANQAVAAARLGAEVSLIAKLGADMFGRQALESFAREGIDTDSIIIDGANPSGVALITIDAAGENCIVVAPGTNGKLAPADLLQAEDKIENARLILVQLEIPLETVAALVDLAGKHGVPVVLNPAPAVALPDSLLAKLAMIIPNQHEAEMLTGVAIVDQSSAEHAARALASRGVGKVIITMGAAGALLWDEGQSAWVDAPAVTAIDTTAAGDVFCGALAVALAEGKILREAVTFACAAAALSVTKMGAQPSAPARAEVEGLRLKL